MLKALVETHEGWEVCGEAENGRDAVTKAQELKPDLMIMDMAMPVMDGIRASRELSKAMPAVPILMHTLHYSAELEIEARKAGIRRVVAKVDSGEELLNAIEGLLSRPAAPSGSANTLVAPISASELKPNSH
jgi:DNA-binding NarL/FixJ family response regulator